MSSNYTVSMDSFAGHQVPSVNFSFPIAWDSLKIAYWLFLAQYLCLAIVLFGSQQSFIYWVQICA
jgi:hypothetical protein